MRVALLLVSLMVVSTVPVSGEDEVFVMSQTIEEGQLKVTATTNPNSSYEFIQNGLIILVFIILALLIQTIRRV